VAGSANGEEEIRLLVTDELVEFEKSPVQVWDFRQIADPFRGICSIYLE
jgi:hypothetical protein